MISAVIFDLDGTLVETEELKALSHACAVRELRPEIEESEVTSAYAEDLVGHSRREVATALIKRFDLETALRARMSELGEDEPWRALVHIRHDIYEALLEDHDLLFEKRYPHNIELLLELRREGYPTALATMSHRDQVQRILAVLKLEDAFDVVATMDDVERGKPHPEIDLLVAQKMSVPPEEFLVVEDSSAGVRAALAAGMAVVAVPTGITRNGIHRLEEEAVIEARWIVEDPQNLPEVVSRRIDAAGGKREETMRPII